MSTPKFKFFLLSCLGVVFTANVHAFSFHQGGMRGSFDTDLTYGLSVRTEDADTANLGAYGNRNFNHAGDLFSHSIKASSTLTLNYKNTGLLARGNYYYDAQYDQETLAKDAKDQLVSHATLTDAFIYGYFGSKEQINVRLGKQVISWGENTFIQGALNDINTVDVNQLRQPGIALKDAFIGTNAAYISWAINPLWMVESFYLFDFTPIQTDPAGAFFATLDAIGEGGGYDDAGDGVLDGACLSADGFSCGLGALTRNSSQYAKGGQYGFALRRFFPTLFNGSEVAVYYQNLHNHLPTISSYYGQGQFFLEYVENIERFGISFNTNISKWAISGEYSLRKDAPIQLTDAIIAANSGGVPIGQCALGACALGQTIRGYDTLNRHQIQMTFQRIWGVNYTLGADDSSSIIEVAYGWLSDTPSNPILDTAITGPARTLFNSQVSQNFSGFQLQHSLTYNAALFRVINLTPYVALKYDVKGVSNEISPVFIEDRKALTLGINASYGNETVTAGLSWTMFDGSNALVNEGGSRLNDSTDRDFIQANISYAF